MPSQNFVWLCQNWAFWFGLNKNTLTPKLICFLSRFFWLIQTHFIENKRNIWKRTFLELKQCAASAYIIQSDTDRTVTLSGQCTQCERKDTCKRLYIWPISNFINTSSFSIFPPFLLFCRPVLPFLWCFFHVEASLAPPILSLV